jgi:uncharacterized membrane protein YgdD (TMEM256/DUF423 family)
MMRRLKQLAAVAVFAFMLGGAFGAHSQAASRAPVQLVSYTAVHPAKAR